MKFSNLSIAKKLIIGFGAVVAVIAISSTSIFLKVRDVTEVERLNSLSDEAVNEFDLIRGDLAGAQAAVRKFVLTNSAADKSKLDGELGLAEKHFDELSKMFRQDAPMFLADLADFKTKFDGYVTSAIKVEADLASNVETRAKAMEVVSNASGSKGSTAVEAAAKALREKVSSWSDQWTAKGAQGMTEITWISGIAGALTLVLSVLMAWIMVRAIGRPLQHMTGAMRELAAGNNEIVVPALGQGDEIGQMAASVQVFKEAAKEKLALEAKAAEERQVAESERVANERMRAEAAERQRQVVEALAAGLECLSDGNLVFRLNKTFADDYEKLRADFNAAMTKLQEAMRVVSSNTSAIRSGSHEITSAADDLSRRTEQQAASLEETAAALDEITATVKKTAEGALHARDVVTVAKSDAEESSRVVRRAIESMSGIEASSRQIGQIIGVIDEIAFQTNLLALNAGVEAARAGDAGRGFAVVASEVRALAQRAAEAAKEIKTLISASVSQVEEGVELVGLTGKSLERILAQVSEISGVVADIAASAQEQSTALGEVNTAVNQMDQVTQQNAAMVEESTAASHSLAQDAESLATLVGQFRTGDTAAASVVRLPPPKSAAQKATRAPVAAMKHTRTTGGSIVQRLNAVARVEDKDWEEF